MNRDKLYTQWIHQRRKVPSPDHFTHRVMASIQNQQPVRHLNLFDRLDPRPHLPGRWIAALGLIALGLFRILFVTANLFLGSPL